MLIKDYTPPSLYENLEFKNIVDVSQLENDEYNNLIEDIVNQCFINTATWGLDYLEKLIGITTDTSKALEQRREVIKSALIGHGTVTVGLIKETASAYSNAEVEVTENIEPFTFQIKFVGTKGIPLGLEDLKKRIDIIKPAHLLVKYVFIYNTWTDIQGLTWSSATTSTWEQLKVR